MKQVLVYSRRFNASYNKLFLALMREGRNRGWCFSIVEPTERKDEAERVAEIFSLLKPAGFIGGYVGDAPVEIPAGLPSVWIDTSHAPKGACVVRHDNASFGRAAAHALEDGGTNFAVFGLTQHTWSGARERAFAGVIREKGHHCRTIRLDAYVESQFSSLGEVRKALEVLPRPVSIFAVTDRLANIVLVAAESLGLSCPGDIRVVGVDDDEIVCMGAPVTLSSVHPDWAQGGLLAAEALTAQMRGERVKGLYTYGASGVTRRASTRDPYHRPKDARVDRALAFMASEFASPITIGDVVRTMGCSRGHALLRFREETGKTILETLEDMRWERLRVLLSRKEADISALPAQCGFRTASALRQFFRRRTGMSMTQWRTL